MDEAREREFLAFLDHMAQRLRAESGRPQYIEARSREAAEWFCAKWGGTPVVIRADEE